jgi:hypothetical protein
MTTVKSIKLKGHDGKWISIKDELPEHEIHSIEYEYVLVFSDINGPERVGIAERRKGKWNDITGGAHWDTGYWDLCDEDITHWMPVPLSPDYKERDDK